MRDLLFFEYVVHCSDAAVYSVYSKLLSVLVIVHPRQTGSTEIDTLLTVQPEFLPIPTNWQCQFVGMGRNSCSRYAVQKKTVAGHEILVEPR